jgi:NADPH:quinone reductase-like Zn-dependent oxidoreductase
MKAIVFRKYGSTDVLHLEEVDKPTPGADEALVKVHAVSINSWDSQLLAGKPFVNRILFGLRKPKKINILGCDIAGQVEAVGSDVRRLKSGDEVFGDLSAGRWGGFAEYVCAREKALTLKPAGMTFEQAAATPQAAVIALQGLSGKVRIQPGQKVLINGAGGSAGSFAVQIAKSYGAEVTGVDSTEKLDMMRSIGADHVIDFTQEDFTRNGQRYDVILDMEAHHSLRDYRRALSPAGTYLVAGGSLALALRVLLLGPWFSLFGEKRMRVLALKQNKDMAVLNELFEAGKVVSVIDKSYSLTEVPEALRYFGDGHARGKIVITI